MIKNIIRIYARVYIDGKIAGQLYRGNGYETTLRLPASPKGAKLDIFIEAMGRINYSPLMHDRKGITDWVELFTVSPEGHQLTYDLRNWDVRLLPLEYDFVKDQLAATYGSSRGPRARDITALPSISKRPAIPILTSRRGAKGSSGSTASALDGSGR